MPPRILALFVFASVSVASAAPGRDVAAALKAMALHSGDQRVVDAVRTLDETGHLVRMIRIAQAGGIDEEAPRARPAPTQPRPQAVAPRPAPAPGTEGSITADKARAIALAYARPRLGANGEGAIVTAVKEIAGPGHLFRVTIMPGTRLTLLFFMTYDVDVDASTGQVIRMK
jgi:hypothetical protein